MNLKQIFNLTVVGVIVTQVPLLTAETSIATPDVMRFECIQLSNHQTKSKFATVPVLSDGTKKTPLFLWKTQEFSQTGYTPKRRCQEVTDRLNAAATANGGIENLWLTVGRINHLGVLCYVNNTSSGCGRNNVLFTFNHNNDRDPAKIIAKMLNFSIKKSGEEPYLNLEQSVNNKGVIID
jgi:hypothetical protein